MVFGRVTKTKDALKRRRWRNRQASKHLSHSSKKSYDERHSRDVTSLLSVSSGHNALDRQSIVGGGGMVRSLGFVGRIFRRQPEQQSAYSMPNLSWSWLHVRYGSNFGKTQSGCGSAMRHHTDTATFTHRRVACIRPVITHCRWLN